MTWNIRWRIGLSVFLLVATFQVTVSVYALARVHGSQLQIVDDHLFEGLAELQSMLHSDALELWVRTETAHNTKWDEDFYEVRRLDGSLVVASANVPAEGFRLSDDARPLRPRRRHLGAGPAARVGEQIHPASKKKHRRVRIAEAVVDGQRLITGESLKVYEIAYWSLRGQLAWGLCVVSLLVPALEVLDRGIDLKCNTEAVVVRGDASQLRNAILNLLDHALRHAPRGASRCTCRTPGAWRA